MVSFDTGLLLELFVQEIDSAKVVALVGTLNDPIACTSFQRAEFHNALQVKAGRKEISASDAVAAAARFRAELRSGVLISSRVNWTTVFARTIRISTTHGAATLCRALDAIHVAIALHLGVKRLASTDRRQVALARACGLQVLTH